MKKIFLLFLIIFSNGLIAQNNAIVIRKIYGKPLLFPAVFCDDSIQPEFRNKYVSAPFYDSLGISIDFISYSIMDSLDIDSIAKTLNAELKYYKDYNIKNPRIRFGIIEISYIKNSKVVWRDTLHHFNLFQLVLYKTAIDLYSNKQLYNEVSCIFFKFLSLNTLPPPMYARDK